MNCLSKLLCCSSCLPEDTTANRVSEILPKPKIVSTTRNQYTAKQSNKVLYATAVVVGLVALAVLAFGIMGLMQAHGVNIPHLASSLNAMSTPHSWGFWLMGSLGAAGVITIGSLLGKSLLARQKQQKELEDVKRNEILPKPEDTEKPEGAAKAENPEINADAALINGAFGDHFEDIGFKEEDKTSISERLINHPDPENKGTYNVRYQGKKDEDNNRFFIAKLPNGKIVCTKFMSVAQKQELCDALSRQEFISTNQT